MDCHLLDRRRREHHDWQINKDFHYFLPLDLDAEPFIHEEDPKFPHVVAFLCDNAPIRLDMLSHAELNTMMILGSVAASDAWGKKHLMSTAYPVRLDCFPKRCTFLLIILRSPSPPYQREMSVLFRRHYYLEDNSFTVVSTETPQLTKGITVNMQEYLRLLSWVIADPIHSN